MMTKLNGFIETMGADGKRFKLDDGNWYSAFKSDQIKAGKGDYVEFTYAMNGTFRNVKGSVNKATAPADAPTKPYGATASERGAKFVAKEFPVPPLHPDRSIIRQNSLSHACEVVNMAGDWSCGEKDIAERVIEIARMFEAYSTGDLDQGIADEAVKQMLARETNN